MDDTDCDPLFEDRAAVNRSPDNHFYQVDDPDGELTGMPGIGLLGNAPAVTLIAGRAGVDLNRDGKAEHFELCTTGEGLRFDVRTGDQSPPLWSGYYYLGYDLESSCPD